MTKDVVKIQNKMAFIQVNIKNVFTLFWVCSLFIGASKQAHCQNSDSLIQLQQCKQLVFGPNGSYYSITTQNDLIKYDSSFKTLFTQHYKSFGKATCMDASNPFDVSIFYSDDNIILVSDNNLTAKFQIDLNNLGQNFSAFAKSYDNEFLLFEANLKKIIKFNAKGEIIKQTNNLEQTTGDVLQPKILYDNGQNLLVYDEKNIIYSFDLNGRMIKKWNLGKLHFINFDKESYYTADSFGFYRHTISKNLVKVDTLFEAVVIQKVANSSHFKTEEMNYYMLNEQFLFIEKSNDILCVPISLMRRRK